MALHCAKVASEVLVAPCLCIQSHSESFGGFALHIQVVMNSFFLQHAFAMLFTSLFHLRTICTFLKADMPLYMY